MEKQTLMEKANNWARNSISLKLFSIGVLILILLIPSSMLTSLIHERENIRDGAVGEVSAKWGNSQIIGGPVLSIPYSIVLKNEQGKTESEIRYAHFLPDEINITGNINPEKRYRGIYVVVLYNTKLTVKGSFAFPKLDELNVPIENFILKDAFISVGITDMKGIKDNILFHLNDSSFYFNPGIVTDDIFKSGISFPINLAQIKEDKYTFDFCLNINGSKDLSFLPFGKETNVTLSSAWSNPSFTGAFLPENRNVHEQGFKATWKVLQLNRNYPQQGLGAFINSKNNKEDIEDNDAAFGVKLLLPIDEYQKTMRSTKYNVMFIILTFLTFFFVEILNKNRIHPIQYLLIGFAICLFYVLLLSISEHLKFDTSYLLSCICILALITFYAKNIFKSFFITALICIILAIFYGFFYSLLQLQDYALLMGSVGLLLILGTIMYLTRNIDWYSISKDDKNKV